MKAIQQLIVASLFAVSAAGAIAQEATPDTWMKSASTKSRAQVLAELEQARKDGTINAGSLDYDFVGQVAATKSREQVRAETAAARASGEYDALNAEVYSFRFAPRSQVYAKAQ